MKKACVAVVGGLLFIAGYFQAQRQTRYLTSRVVEDRSLQAKPMVIPVKTNPLFAFRLSKPFFNAQ